MDYRSMTHWQRIGLTATITFVICCLAATTSYAQSYTFTTIDVPGASSTFAQGINNSGQIVGGYTVPPPDRNGRQATNVFVLSNGNFSTFSFPGAFFSVGFGINSSGQIAGVCQAEFFRTFGQCQDFFGVGDGWVQTGGSFSSVSFPGAIANATNALGINDQGQVVGQYELPSGDTFGYVLSAGSYTTVNPFNSVGSQANGINNAGDVVGWYCVGNCNRAGFLQVGSGGNITTISVPGTTNTFAVGVNSSDVVVGYYNTGSGPTQGFVWQNGNFTFLNDPLGTQGTFATGINDAGQVVGFYVDGGRVQHGFMATASTCPVKPTDVKLHLDGLSLDMKPIDIFASFTPSGGATLDELASACGFTGFDWVQMITHLPGPSGFFRQSDPSVPIIIPPQAPINDPPLGGYTYQFSPGSQFAIFQPNFATAAPFYYSPLDISSGCAEWSNNGCSIPIIGNLDFTLTFFDGPGNPCLPGSLLSLGGRLFSLCQGPSSGPPFESFTTQLVGICNAAPSVLCSGNGKPSTPLFQWTWNDNFNGTTGGGIFQTASGIPLDPTSGTGGVTITGVNGVLQTPPSVTCAATPNVLWPPNGKEVSVNISGSITAGTSAIVADSPAFLVRDSEGQVQATGLVTVEPDGTYSFAISLIASRDGNNMNGRQYTIGVTAADEIGNLGSCLAIVTVPHDQGH